MNNVLVLLATYNGESWLTEQLSTLLGQEGVCVTINASDDFSSDLTPAILQQYPQIRLLEFCDSSGGAGQNFLRLISASDFSGFDFIAFSDQDDLWNLDKLRRAIEKLTQEGGEAYSSSVTAFWPDGKERVLTQCPSQTDIDFLFEGAGQGCTFVLRRTFAESIQEFVRTNRADLTSIHYHDWLIYALARVQREKWVFDAAPSMRYRQHSGNDTGARGALRGITRRLGLIRRGWYAKQVSLMVELVSKADRDLLPSDFVNAWRLPRGLRRRVILSWILIRRGRRRLSDRLVLFGSSLLGWI